MASPANTRFSLAVHLLTLLAEASDQNLDSSVLSVSPASNPAHVRRVLGLLRERGIVSSQSGPHGGWALARSPKEIHLDEVWGAVTSDEPVLGLHVPDPNCPTGRAVQLELRDLDRRAQAVVTEELGHVSLADVLTTVVKTRTSR